MMPASGSPLQALTPNPDKNSTCVVAALLLSVGFARHRLDTARDLGASLGEDFRRQRVVDARAHDGSGRSQHISQLTSRADCAALRGCSGCEEQPHDAVQIARYKCQACDGDSAPLQWMLALLAERPNTRIIATAALCKAAGASGM